MSVDSLNIFRQTMAIICCLFGLPGNILTIIVCIRALYHRSIQSQQKVFHLYLIEISILDTFLLLYLIIETLLNYLHSIGKSEFLSLMDISAFSCYFFYISNRLCAAFCSWLLTCFTFIRFINIFRQFNTIRSNLIFFLSLIITFSLANSYSFVVLEYNSEQNYHKNKILFNHTEKNETTFNNQTLCTIRLKYAEHRSVLFLNTLVAGVLSLAVPSILILIVNISMLCFIKRIYSSQVVDNMRRRSDGTNYRSASLTLVIISMTYVLFYIPYIIFYFLMIHVDDRDDTLHYWSEITYILRHVSHSVNFYAYMSTSLRFRKESLVLLRYLIQPCLIFKKRNQSQRKKRSEIILMDKSPLPPPPLPRLLPNSINGKLLRPIYIHRLVQSDLKHQGQNLLNGKHETWM